MPVIDFILIGAMKSGTTTLVDYLRKHPEIYIPGNKELQYFSRDEKYSKGDAWYESYFSSAHQRQICGEGSTCYSRMTKYPNSVRRIHKYAPDVKLIYIVREPIARTYSHFRHGLLAGELDYESFREALESEAELIETSKYMTQINRYLEYFDVSQFLFMKFEELTNPGKDTFTRLFDFLSISDVDVVKQAALTSNKAGTAQARSSVARVISLGRYIPGLSYFVKEKFSPAERKRIRFHLAGKVSNSLLGKYIANMETKQVPLMLPSDREFIFRNCIDDLKEFEIFSNLDLSGWYK